jgi:hypothetical protein
MGYQLAMLSTGAFLAISARSLDFIQLWIPGLIASTREFAAGAIGAWIGLLVTVVLRRPYERVFVISYKCCAAVLPAPVLALIVSGQMFGQLHYG